MSFVTIENLKKSFHQETVLHSINLSIKEGEFVTLLGPSGCGKSTLLRSIAGLLTPEEGLIYIDGKNVTNVKPKDRQVGMVFQSYALFPNMTVQENIEFGLKMKKHDQQTIKRKVARIVELVELGGKEASYPRELSGGQQQRVALARSLVTEPKVLLLDEPLSALDAQIRKNLQKQLRAIQQELNMTTVLVTHDQEEAMAVSDYIYILNNGVIAQSGTPHEIYTRPANEFVARFIGNYNVLTGEQLSKLFGNQETFLNNLYAIRPEAFSPDPLHEAYEFSGEIQAAMMLGNITRYELDANGVTVTADHLHKNDASLQRNQFQKLYLHRKDVIPLS
ncbi:ABC transporter ATP-binding protein [Bacillus salipaludis]|uniref:Carnitine transport ATP-binding protein OpuCA n=1 Tax=Bacillus salipaludis TaxID=2547811 RepID=A0A4R5VR62_9BACI|nr:ABC transporter ATP-binding protein [Bacillus salipaludis]TDK60869.1 ABC transporter ATP-binding protein [Bacillus salipaludis]